MKQLKFSLILISLIFFVLTIIFQKQVIVMTYFPNLATELIGIIVTLMFVDEFIKRRNEKEKRLRTEGALSKVQKAFGRFLKSFG